jgi:hypothetical protein
MISASNPITYSHVTLVLLDIYSAANAAQAHATIKPYVGMQMIQNLLKTGGSLSLRQAKSVAELRQLDDALSQYGYGLEY